MGYFSRLAVDLIEKREKEQAKACPKEIDLININLNALYSMLYTLEEIRPHEPLDPLYDYYYYEDYIIGPYDDPCAYVCEDMPRNKCTIQGVMRAIKELEEQLELHKQKESEDLIFRLHIALADETPNGQRVLYDAFNPIENGCIRVAA